MACQHRLAVSARSPFRRATFAPYWAEGGRAPWKREYAGDKAETSLPLSKKVGCWISCRPELGETTTGTLQKQPESEMQAPEIDVHMERLRQPVEIQEGSFGTTRRGPGCRWGAPCLASPPAHTESPGKLSVRVQGCRSRWSFAWGGKIPVFTVHPSWRRSCCLMLVSDCGLRLMSGSLPPKSCRSHHAKRRKDRDLHIKLFFLMRRCSLQRLQGLESWSVHLIFLTNEASMPQKREGCTNVTRQKINVCLLLKTEYRASPRHVTGSEGCLHMRHRSGSGYL